MTCWSEEVNNRRGPMTNAQKCYNISASFGIQPCSCLNMKKMMQVCGCHGIDFKRLLDGLHLDHCHLPLHGDYYMVEGKYADKDGS